MNAHALKALAGVVLLCSSAPGQAPSAAPSLPGYYIAAGATYGYFGGRGFASTTEIAIRGGGTKLYSYTDIEQARGTSQVAQGAAYVAKAAGNWLVVAIGAVGLSGPSFTGGIEVLYDLGAQRSGGKQHGYLGFFARPLTTSNAKTQPVYGFTIAAGF